MLDEKIVDTKVRQLYESIKHTKKFQSLDLSEQIRMLMSIKQSIINLGNLNKMKEIDEIDGNAIMEMVSERGFNRLRLLDSWRDQSSNQIMELKLSDPTERAKMILELKKKLKDTDMVE